MHKLINLDEVIAKLKTFLPQYLAEHDIDTSKNFKCLNPKHDDPTPSMSCKQNPENAFCFGCLTTLDIFLAAHYLEDKPISGPEFIEQNVKYLAEKYGIDLKLEEMTEEELYRYRTYRAYKDAADLIANRSFGDYTTLDKEIAKRGWNPDTLKVGTVIYKDFRNALKNMGYEPRFQDEIDLGRPDIFNENNMIFTICDEFGRPVGFAARILHYDGEHGPKYLNQKTTGVRCNIYQKSKRLYEIHTALRYTPPIYIFEGYTDVLTAQHAGFFNCCAIGGTGFTQHHIELLKQLNQTSVVLCLDGDNPGQMRTAELLDKFFSCQRDMQVEIVNLPDNLDPDDIIRERGLETFLGLKRWSAFEWRLNRYPDDADPETVCKVMIPLIVNEPSRVRQDKLCSILSRFTGIDKEVITAELGRLQSEKERKKYNEKERVLEQIWSEIHRSPQDTKTLLYECASRIEAIETKYDENSFSIDSTVSFVESQIALEDAMTGEFAGFTLSEVGLGGLGERLNGNWREDVFFCFGGSANAGKSSLMGQFAYEIASRPENNATVIYHTIDDSKEQILPRLVCQCYGSPDLTINQVRNPNYYKKYDPAGDAIAQRRLIGYQELVKLMKDGRIVLKDMSEGSSFAFGEGLIRYYQNLYPERKIVYILDNLHKSPDYSSMEPRMRFKTLSNHMKETAGRLHCCIMATVEYTKLEPGIIPHNNNIAETRAVIYDASFIGHLFNDLHENGPSAVCIHNHQGEVLPRLRLGIGKNKITEFKGRIFLDFFPASGLFRKVATEIAEHDMKALMADRRDAKKQSGKDDKPASEGDKGVE